MAQRRLSAGAEVLPAGGVHFRVWAPKRSRVEVVIEGGPGAGAAPSALRAEGDGWFSGAVASAAAGTLYRYRLDGGDAFPDPASRFQPAGPHGPSEVVDPDSFAWTDGEWRGVPAKGQVIYELHVGCFTPEGTWAAAAEQLPQLARLGITLLEVMPVAEFPGEFGWGYDGVDLYAPTRLYGRPDHFRRFVDRAHAAGMGVILDVVYNHLGPDGNYLTEFGDSWFTDRHETEWGDPVNFYGPGSGPVREFYVQNAAYWIREFHLDGLRLDATQNIYDREPRHVVAELARAAREAAATRTLFIVAENEPQETVLVRPAGEGGWGLDAMWNDDFHHAAMVALTGRAEAYYSDYRGTPQELVSAAKWGFLFQGQRYGWQKQRRGTPSFGVPAHAFVTFIQNHDQVANSDSGKRIHQLASPPRVRAMTALALLMPGTPMLFMGQEFAASARWVYFADHEPELAEKVYAGRKEFLAQLPSIAAPEMQARIPDPADRATFEACKLDLHERETNAAAYALHRDLLRLRRETSAFAAQDAARMHGAVLGPAALCLRFLHEDGDRLLVVNLGTQVDLAPAPEPLLAPPPGMRWETVWSSESPEYDGAGTPPVETPGGGWLLPGETAVVLAPAPQEEAEEEGETNQSIET
ncbi:MAG TPA: malto-oligosyltrehalose trehalohydrolase [Longimicrobium sp.]